MIPIPGRVPTTFLEILQKFMETENMELDVIKYVRWRHIYGPHRGGPTLQSPAYKFRL